MLLGLRTGVVVALVIASGLGCPRPPIPRPPVGASLQLATRQSCGLLSGLDYDTSCLAAVYVRVLDESRQKIFEECRVLDQRSADLGELLQGEPILTVNGLSAQKVVTFEVRGIHDVGAVGAGDGPCANPASNDNWLFWGESDPVDLAAYDDGEGPPLIRIVLDCRDCTDANDVFGCAGITLEDAGSPTTCGPAFPDSFCVPTVACDKGCAERVDCFDGARACSAEGTCDVTALTGELCSPCGGLIACGLGFVCVEKPGQEPFCAAPCPDALCPTGTKCNRRGNELDLAD